GDALAYSDAAGEVVPLSLISVSSIRESGARVCNDIWGEPSLAAARENAIKFNVRSLLVLPLWRGSKPAGELTLYSAEPGFFNQEELELATEIAESISFALESLERKQQQQNTEAELRDNRERLELVLDAAEEAYWDWDLESERLQQSPRYDAMLGYGPNEVPRGYQSMLSMTHPEDGDRLNREYLAFRTSDKDSMSNEFRMRCKAGEYIWVFARSKIVARNASGKPTRMVGTLTEITDRKRLEDQFRQAQKLESVGRLAGGVAHDFNNLLTVINGYSKLLLARLPQNDPGRQQLEEIRKAGERGEGLTKQLLAFSRKQVTEPRLLKLNDAAGESEAMLRRLVPTNVEFRAFYGARNDEVVTDPSQVHQILMNLVVNACDAMPTGGNLTVQTANVLLDKQDAAEDSGIKIGQHVLLTVSDTGTGMDDETLRHIFEPFFTTKDVGKGTGLGLSTVYGIVQQCGGFVQAESTIGQGTTFKIYLPVAAEGIRPDSTVQPAASTELIGAETILVVEDQESVRNLAVDTLRAYGYSVIAAPGGVDALRLASKHKGPIHLLLTDIMMPSMNGKTLAGEIRRVRPETKVIYMSGYADATVVGSPAGELNPDTAYLQKPFLPEALGIKVRQTLMHRAIRRTVLVVEDESAIRDLFMEFLGGRHNVLLASNGAEALRLLRSQADIDLVITDLVMPDQEGIDVIRGARKLRPGLKVIAMSGAFGGKFLKTAELLGADATLVKPVRPEVLDQVIEEVLGRSA
ncbi:MAG TPA: response regulator, partial [Bryobacteraceae bacterium]|nr:response regulator [Bryobacteraceae bacterium]